MPFVSDLVARQVGDLDWRLVRPLEYEGAVERFQVPVEFETDFASIPGPMQWLLPKSGRHTKAAVLHDYLCRQGPQLGVTRHDADGLFRRTMHEMEVPFLRRWLMWGAVRGVSVLQSRFRDGPWDLLQVFLVLLFPGLLVLLGGTLVWLMLLGFAAVEAVSGAVLALLRTIPGPTRRVKPVVPPKVRLSP